MTPALLTKREAASLCQVSVRTLEPQRDALRAIRDDLRDLLGWMTSESDEKRRVENGSGAEPQNVSGPFRIAFAGAA